jgi:3'-phosphoadenosine 5'-phosphosulfate sulfotransferase (PAPS reductase)/FAD synthetase
MDRLARAGYLAHAELPAYQRRVAEAWRLTAEAAELGSVAVMVSGGKDSLIMAHIARAVLGDFFRGFFIDSGAEHPEALKTIETMRAGGYSIETINPERTVIDMLKLIGALGYDGPDKLEGDWHWAAGDYKRILISEPAAAIRDMGYPVALVGLRADESRGRAMSMRKYGPIRERRDGAIIACPLAWWTGEDIFAYALTHDLPLSEIYTRESDEAFERRRTGTMLGGSGGRQGRWARLKRDWPDVWLRLTETFPELERLA